ncbi:MAG: radical SAM protein [Ruminococcaceae bacterium]|nr:radical SAM protein [Oscillospiraceae bacterium]
MNCNLCPRRCGINRKTDTGYCKMGDTVKIAKVMLHMWEEPCISGKKGSGAIFFSGCPLKCVYCQNVDISHGGYGKEYTVETLSQEMLRLQEMGACNINLVTPTHYADKVRQALDLIRGELKIPVVYNTSGYELDSEIAKMAGYVDVFLTDMKYFSPEYSQKYSKASDYYQVAKGALAEMLKIAPKCVFDENGLMQKGVIVRHLVLPTLRKDSIAILQDLNDSFDISKLKLSLMAQYTPEFCSEQYPELGRKITTFEYSSVVNAAIELGYDGYIQDKSASSVKYTPNFREED